MEMILLSVLEVRKDTSRKKNKKLPSAMIAKPDAAYNSTGVWLAT
jgi:hypothetical protein